MSNLLKTGRRKTAIARVRLIDGKGAIFINDRPFEEYFNRALWQKIAKEPLLLTNTKDRFDIYVTVRGGGLTGQAGAVRLGIARALLEIDAGMRPKLKKAGCLTRDPREKERKKYGQAGARARFQFSKR